MKRMIATVSVACVILMSVATSACALEDNYYGEITHKLGRGISNVVFSPLEIAWSTDDAIGAYGYGAGVPTGICHGVGRFVWRAVTGVVDIVTFLVVQEPFDRHLMEPEYVFPKTFDE